MKDRAWEPLLEGELAARAREAVASIADALAVEAIEASPALARGAPGVAVFWAYRARAAAAEGDRREANRSAALADEVLDGAIDAVAEVPLDASLFAGIAGVAWAVEHLRGGLGGEDPNEDVDALLRDHLDTWTRQPGPRAYDLVSGLVGLGVYALERIRRGGDGAALVARVIDRLEEAAERRPEGTAWRTPREIGPASQPAPDGVLDLGVAHGVPGVVALLALAIRAGVEARRARALLDGAARWVLAHDTSEGFPPWAAEGIAPGAARVAWCYGDPGVAAALHLAGRVAEEPAWERAAIAIARRAAARPFAESGIVDAGLCHGAAGVGHVLGRIAHAAGDHVLRDAARAMIARALDHLDRLDRGNLADRGLLEGAAGVGLALIAATSPVAPAWDRVLLLS